MWNIRDIERAKSIPTASPADPTPASKRPSITGSIRRRSSARSKVGADRPPRGERSAVAEDSNAARSDTGRMAATTAAKEAELERRRQERAEQAKRRRVTYFLFCLFSLQNLSRRFHPLGEEESIELRV